MQHREEGGGGDILPILWVSVLREGAAYVSHMFKTLCHKVSQFWKLGAPRMGLFYTVIIIFIIICRYISSKR